MEILCIADGEYKKDINKVNPLGMKGELANAFAQMMSTLWSGTYQSFPPTKIKVYFCHLHIHDAFEFLSAEVLTYLYICYAVCHVNR